MEYLWEQVQPYLMVTLNWLLENPLYIGIIIAIYFIWYKLFFNAGYYKWALIELLVVFLIFRYFFYS